MSHNLSLTRIKVSSVTSTIVSRTWRGNRSREQKIAISVSGKTIEIENVLLFIRCFCGRHKQVNVSNVSNICWHRPICIMISAKDPGILFRPLGLKKKARKHRSNSKLNGSDVQADVSVKQPNKVLAGCWIKSKVMLATMKMKQQQQRDKASEIMWAMTSKTNWSINITLGYFLCCWKNPFGQQGRHRNFLLSLQQCRLYEQFFKGTCYTIYVNSRFDFHRTLSVWDQNSLVAWSFKIQAMGNYNLLLVLF